MLHSNRKTNRTIGRSLLNILGLEKITNTSIENWREIQDHLIRGDYKILKFRDYIQVPTFHSPHKKYEKDHGF